MVEKSRKRDPMPSPDATPEEIGEFWDTHSLTDYLDETHEVEFKVNLKSGKNQPPDELEKAEQKQDIIVFDEPKPNIPASIESATNTALSATSDLILDHAIPAPIRKNLFKALDRLGSALIDVPVVALERRSAEKRAESEARIKITEVVNAQIIKEIKVDPEFPQRASNTFAKKILREQYNLERILGLAADILKNTELNNSKNRAINENMEEQSEDSKIQTESIYQEKTIDDDWFNIFEKEASQKSGEEMQRRFARVLAGEIQKPGSYSIRAVKILSEMNKNIASIFKRLCSACIQLSVPIYEDIMDLRVCSFGGNPGSNSLKKYGLTFDQLNRLNKYNLIISDYNSWFNYNLCVVNENMSNLFSFNHQEKHWVFYPLPDWDKDSNEFRITGVSLSSVGRELFQIVDQDPMPEYTEDLKKFFERKHLQMVEVPSPRPKVSKIK